MYIQKGKILKIFISLQTGCLCDTMSNVSARLVYSKPTQHLDVLGNSPEQGEIEAKGCGWELGWCEWPPRHIPPSWTTSIETSDQNFLISFA